MIKFQGNLIIYNKTIKTKKHKELLLNFIIRNDDRYLHQYKDLFKTWQNHILECCSNKQFKNNIVTEKYFI